jgi:DNA modification methylase
VGSIGVTVRILRGHVTDRLREIPEESVHCVVTSPPYWGLRDYGVEGQLGLERTPDEYIDNMVEVFREVRRALRADGTAWVNMGDSYAGSRSGPDVVSSSLNGSRSNQAESRRARSMCDSRRRDDAQIPRSDVAIRGLKSKDLVGMPWLLAFALRAAGWWLRQDIIWHKPNPMPESVRDRCTKAHEYLFLLSKSERYYYDDEAIREPLSPNTSPRAAVVKPVSGWNMGEGGHDAVAWAQNKSPNGRKFAEDNSGTKSNASFAAAMVEPGRRKSGNKDRKPASARGVPIDSNGESNGAVAGSVPWEGYERNKRSVWTVTTEPFPEAHFATFPTRLVEPCILAGCPEGGTVLDPFGGAGTTGLVADRLNRNAILIELNPAYADMAERRIAAQTLPLPFAEVGT